MKRSYNQKTLALISNHDFPALFLEVLRRMTVTGVYTDPPALETACNEIGNWPHPGVGLLELPFMGDVMRLDM